MLSYCISFGHYHFTPDSKLRSSHTFANIVCQSLSGCFGWHCPDTKQSVLRCVDINWTIFFTLLFSLAYLHIFFRGFVDIQYFNVWEERANLSAIVYL